jgi:hypothetical protein
MQTNTKHIKHNYAILAVEGHIWARDFRTWTQNSCVVCYGSLLASVSQATRSHAGPVSLAGLIETIRKRLGGLTNDVLTGLSGEAGEAQAPFGSKHRADSVLAKTHHQRHDFQASPSPSTFAPTRLTRPHQSQWVGSRHRRSLHRPLQVWKPPIILAIGHNATFTIRTQG